MSFLLKPSRAGKCESVSLNDPFHTLIHHELHQTLQSATFRVDSESLYDLRMRKECVQNIAVGSESPVRFGNGKECVHNIVVDLKSPVRFGNGKQCVHNIVVDLELAVSFRNGKECVNNTAVNSVICKIWKWEKCACTTLLSIQSLL